MTRKVKVGNLILGDKKEIYIQSMINTPDLDIKAAIEQGKRLEKAGCQIIRTSVLTNKSVKTISALKENLSIPVVADIHFDYKLALESIKAGADKIRINPGNIGSEKNVAILADACNDKKIPIRIGVNGSSLEKELLNKYGSPCANALVESAIGHIKLLEKNDFHNIVVSIKSSNVKTMVESYRKLHKICDYPLHLGVTEAGTKKIGILKSAVGIGSLLLDGIGDTIRVSLTDDPVEEIYAAKDILHSIGLEKNRPQIISCPTCSRCKINAINLANRVEDAVKDIKKNITIAVMGCAVNGPGEASQADIGIAGGKGEAIIFKKGKIIKKVADDMLFDSLMEEINKL